MQNPEKPSVASLRTRGYDAGKMNLILTHKKYRMVTKNRGNNVSRRVRAPALVILSPTFKERLAKKPCFLTPRGTSGTESDTEDSIFFCRDS